MNKAYGSFAEFYPHYLLEHQNLVCRRLHFIGSLLVLLILLTALFRSQGSLLLLAPLMGYGLAWIGHFFYEKNKPATFRHPLYSFWGDWVMFKDILIGKIRI